MIINHSIVSEQVTECIIVVAGQYRHSGVVVYINQAHDVAVNIAVLGARKIAVGATITKWIFGIRGVVASEGDLVANFGEEDGFCIGCPCGSVCAVFHR